MKPRLLLIILLCWGFSSCATDKTGNTQTDRPAAFSDRDVWPGVVSVRLTPEAERALNIETRSSSFSTGNIDLDNLAAQLGAFKMTRTFDPGGIYEERQRKAGLHLWYDIYFEESIPVTRAVGRFSDLPIFDLVEPVKIKTLNVLRGATLTAEDISYFTQTRASEHPSGFNDPMIADQWHYYNDGSLSSAKAGADINVIPAWKINTGHPDVIVCIVDGGVQLNHPDLTDLMWVNEAELNGSPGVDDDNNGYIDDIYGWDFANDDNTIEGHFHGTHVAGTVAAINNNGIGVAGVAGGNGTPGTGVRMISAQSSRTPDDINIRNAHKGIVYGANMGAVISQNSWTAAPPLSSVDKAAIDYFIQYAGTDPSGEVQVGPMKGGIAIFAAGNYNSNTKYVPASYDATVAVAAMAPNFVRASYSNYGTWVNIVAPGGDQNPYGSAYGVLSTSYKSDYQYMSGTSMACPHVSGIAALVVSEKGVGKPGFTPEELKSIILGATHDIEPYNAARFAGQLGYGYIDAEMAMNGINTVSAPNPVTDLTGEWTDNSASFTWSVTEAPHGGNVFSYKICISETELIRDNIVTPPAGSKYTTVKVDGANVGDKLTALFSGISGSAEYYIAIVGFNARGIMSEATIFKGRPTLQEEVFAPMNITTPTTVDFDDIFTGNGPLSYSLSINPENLMTVEHMEGGSYKFTPGTLGIGTLSVKVTDTNRQSYTFTTIVSNRTGTELVEFFPNPVGNTLNMRMAEAPSNPVEVNIFNSAGAKVITQTISIAAYQPAAIDMSRLGSGVYTVRVKLPAGMITKTITKI